MALGHLFFGTSAIRQQNEDREFAEPRAPSALLRKRPTKSLDSTTARYAPIYPRELTPYNSSWFQNFNEELSSGHIVLHVLDPSIQCKSAMPYESMRISIALEFLGTLHPSRPRSLHLGMDASSAWTRSRCISTSLSWSQLVVRHRDPHDRKAIRSPPEPLGKRLACRHGINATADAASLSHGPAARPALAAGLFLKVLCSSIHSPQYGLTDFQEGMTPLLAICLEAAGTFLLCTVAFVASTRFRHSPRNRGGLIVTAALFLLTVSIGPFTGASFNPSRSLGPALASMIGIPVYLLDRPACWEHHHWFRVPHARGAQGQSRKAGRKRRCRPSLLIFGREYSCFLISP